MSRSPIDQKIDLLEIEVKVEGNPIDDSYRVMKMEIVNEVFKIPYAIIELLDGNAAEETFEISSSEDFIPGKKVTINLGYHQETTEIFEGIIVNHRIKIGSNHPRLIIKCFDEAIKMTADRKSTYFLGMTDSDVMSKLIGDHSLSSSLDSTSFQHKELIQYHSSDWDFLMTRAEVNGLLVYAENGEVFVKKPVLSGSADISLTFGTDISKIDLDIDSGSQLKAVECSAWDPNTQKIVKSPSTEPSADDPGNITGKKLSDVISSTDFLLQTSGKLEDGMLKEWANARLLKSRLSRIRGTVSFLGVEGPKPNTLIELNGLGDRFNGNAFVSGVVHEISSGSWTTTAKIGLSPNWFSETKHDISVPSASGVLPGIDGLHIGLVRNIHEDPDGEHRIKVDIPTITESGDGVWARMSHLYATNNAGSFFYPEIGDEVLLGFLNNDPRFPVILGKLYSQKNVPPFEADDKNTHKAIVTNKQMKFVFDDDKIECWIETPAGNKLTFSDDQKSITMEDQHGNKMVMDDSGIQIESPKDISIKATGKMDLEATGAISIKSDQDVKMQGLNVEAKANVGFKAEGSASAELKASGQTTVKGAIVMIN
ncbi:MAG: type VI secretion system tip protein VgrG [Bacteroidota bacterium]